MEYPIRLTPDDLALINLAIMELPEKARLRLAAKFQAQIAAHEKAGAEPSKPAE